MVNFDRESIIQAIEKIDNQPELRNGRNSIEYDLNYKNKSYPPILVLSEASKMLGGSELKLSDFSNSTRKPFEILKSFGFEVVKKDLNFYNQLKQFLDQADSKELKTKHYIQAYAGYKVEVSFGKGNQARIPWIAFLGNDNTVSKGIYPVYLYFKSLNLLILAYGVSETNKPLSNWTMHNGVSISNYFSSKNFPPPERYGNSYVYADYDISEQHDSDLINRDLEKLLHIYELELSKQEKALQTSLNTIDENPDLKMFNLNKKFDYRSFLTEIDKAGLVFNEDISVRFIASLLSKPFVILTGLSGSGKTKLAQAFAMWMASDEEQICIIPVGADWTNREPLLGYPNALEKGTYVSPDSGALNLLIEASKPENMNRPYFLILDEMNLSHVERYFADFLSAMESSRPIPLHVNSNDWMDETPHSVKLSRNVFIIGTVNIDETTYMFSPKVLDRANVIEFRVRRNELEAFLKGDRNIDISSLSGKGADSSRAFLEMSDDRNIKINDAENLNSTLLLFYDTLSKIGAEFGYRTASEVKRFAAIVNKLNPEWPLEKIVDAAIMQKLLPKVHGSRRKLEPILKSLALLCLKDKLSTENPLDSISHSYLFDPESFRFPISMEKILRMQNALINNGFTSYAEA
ncbi:DUF3578 domain-containing protein [Flavisolibacter sp. BT320]|nr:DUF3578 domain-containing protein [Flavisolibacter longurius]